MYIQGGSQYDYHVKTYGHPSKFGYKDICHIWRAENWKPEELIRLYARTGAKYFVALANHHGNFDCWNSKHHPWNCVNIGPKRDIVGTWKRSHARRGSGSGLRFTALPAVCGASFCRSAMAAMKRVRSRECPIQGFLQRAMAKASGGTAWIPSSSTARRMIRTTHARNSWIASCCASR